MGTRARDAYSQPPADASATAANPPKSSTSTRVPACSPRGPEGDDLDDVAAVDEVDGLGQDPCRGPAQLHLAQLLVPSASYRGDRIGDGQPCGRRVTRHERNVLGRHDHADRARCRSTDGEPNGAIQVLAWPLEGWPAADVVDLLGARPERGLGGLGQVRRGGGVDREAQHQQDGERDRPAPATRRQRTPRSRRMSPGVVDSCSGKVGRSVRSRRRLNAGPPPSIRCCGPSRRAFRGEQPVAHASLGL